MRRQRIAVENAQVHHPLDRRLAIAPACVINVAAVLRDMDMETRAQRLIRLRSAPQGAVTERKRSVQSKAAGHQAVALAPAVAFKKTDVLSDALRRACAPIAVGSLVAQNPAQADFPKRLLDPVQASTARIGAGVMVHQRAHPALGGVNQAHQRAVVNIIQVEGAVQPPPELLQNLRKVPRGAPGKRDSPRQCAVKMRVAVDQGRHQKLALGVEDFVVGRCRTGAACRALCIAIAPMNQWGMVCRTLFIFCAPANQEGTASRTRTTNHGVLDLPD